MIKYVTITLAFVLSTYGAVLDPNGLVHNSGSNIGLDPLFPADLHLPTDLHLPVDPQLPIDPRLSTDPQLNLVDPWLSWDNHSFLQDYIEPAPSYRIRKCLTTWKVKQNALRYDDSWVSSTTVQPTFRESWLSTLAEYEKRVTRGMENFYNMFHGRMLSRGLEKTKLENFMKRSVFPRIYPDSVSGLVPAHCPENIQQATLEQLMDIMEFWHQVYNGAYKDCKKFQDAQCGSKFNFCDKPKTTRNDTQSFTDVCAEHKIDVDWVRVEDAITQQAKDCWVPPGQNLYYVKCHTPGKVNDNACKLDYATQPDLVCVPSAKIKRKAWVLCPIGQNQVIGSPRLTRPTFTIGEIEVITPTGCSCMKCDCCQFTKR